MFAIVVSVQDIAGMNIREQLLKQFVATSESYQGTPVYKLKNIKLYTTKLDSINCENIDEEINPELILFATKHKSVSGTPSLSVHAPGNWGAAKLGGLPGQVCIAPALYLKKAFQLLSKTDTTYQITLEATHHGPFLSKKPCFFIEIGSTEREWSDPVAGKIIANTIIQTLTLPLLQSPVPCIGLGGGHYAPYFNKIQLQTKYAIGHIVPKYAIDNLSQELLKQAIERTSPKAELVLLDWKGLGPRKQEIMGWIKTLGIPSQRCRKL